MFECNDGRFSADADSSSSLKAAAANRQRGSARNGTACRRNRSDSQRHIRQLNDGQSGGRERENSLPVFIDGKKVAMQPVDVARQHRQGLPQNNSNPQLPAEGIDNTNSASNS